MKREIDLEQISDGRLYTANDMVKIGCNDCAGCSSCCRLVGNTILLDPYDLYQLEQVLETGFEGLLAERIELQVIDGLIQPNLKMGREEQGCTFLDAAGRCSIHDYRPGFCRMFPMGRIYQEDGFRYFLQVHECEYPHKTKVKLRKWLGIPSLDQYEEYIRNWHFFRKDMEEIVDGAENDAIVKNLNMYLLEKFYVNQYDTKTCFYTQFYERLKAAREFTVFYR